MTLFSSTLTALSSFLPHALHDAARNGHANQLKRLLAKYPQQRKRINSRAGGSLTPLDLATVHTHYQCMVILLEAGADPNMKSLYYSQCTLLRCALSWQDKTTVRLLIIYGANIDIKDGHGKSCRDCFNQYPEVMETFACTLRLKEQLDKAQALAERALSLFQDEQAAQHLHEICQIWQTLAQAETQLSLQQHYCLKALQAIEQALNYATSDELQASAVALHETFYALKRQSTSLPQLLTKFFARPQRHYGLLSAETELEGLVNSTPVNSH